MSKISIAAVTIIAALIVAPAAFGALSGSGNVTDVVQLSTTTGTLSALSSTPSGASGAPVASSSAFTMTNSGSNVDTFVRYAWGTTPYYGASTSATTITIRGTTHAIGDLLWFRQQTLTADSTATTSEYFSPLLVKNAATVLVATFTSSGNACTGWSGSAGSGFSAAAAGTFTFQYQTAASPSNDAASTSDTFHYCLDTTNAQVYLAKSASFTSATRVYSYASDSANSVLNTYQYQALSGSQSVGNFYCLASITGTGTSATPDLAQCQKLPYETAGSTTIKLFALHDPPAYFPSVNQAGTVTYAIAGTQWNPYASSTTNTA